MFKNQRRGLRFVMFALLPEGQTVETVTVSHAPIVNLAIHLVYAAFNM